MYRRTSLLFLIATTAFILPRAVRSQTDTLVVPQEAAQRFGNGSGELFGPYSSVWQIYGASEFASASSDLLLVTEVAFRMDETQQHAFQPNLDYLRINMARYTGSVQQALSAVIPFAQIPVSSVFFRSDYTTSARAAS